MPIAALYVRVSTADQTAENQKEAVTALATARGYECCVYEEVESAVKARPVYERMMADVRAGRIHAVVVVALDRLHRSMQGSVNTVLELDRLGVPVISVREGWLDTSGPVRGLLVAIFGWVNEREREVIRERSKAGVERARRTGTKSGRPIGRPPASSVMLRAAADLVRAGESVAGAARAKGVHRNSLRRYLDSLP